MLFFQNASFSTLICEKLSAKITEFNGFVEAHDHAPLIRCLL